MKSVENDQFFLGLFDIWDLLLLAGLLAALVWKLLSTASRVGLGLALYLWHRGHLQVIAGVEGFGPVSVGSLPGFEISLNLGLELLPFLMRKIPRLSHFFLHNNSFLVNINFHIFPSGPIWLFLLQFLHFLMKSFHLSLMLPYHLLSNLFSILLKLSFQLSKLIHKLLHFFTTLSHFLHGLRVAMVAFMMVFFLLWVVGLVRGFLLLWGGLWLGLLLGLLGLLGLFLEVLLLWLGDYWGLWGFGLWFWGNGGLWNGLRDDDGGLWNNNGGWVG